MVLDFDPTEAVHRPADLARLVDAVGRAAPEDETDWLEWKRSGDLTGKETQFKLSKEILGLANRDPVDASRFVGGYGYVIVGAEAGTCDGVVRLDVADLDKGMRRYLGDDGPHWSPHYVAHAERDVLVIKVEPPRDGDPIFTLRQEFSPHREGTIFVRKGTRSEPASSADVERLVRRANASPSTPPLGPNVAVAATGEAIVVREDEVRSHIAHIVSEMADDIVAEGRKELGVEGEPSSGLDGMMASIRGTAHAAAYGDDWDQWVSTVVAWQAPAMDAAWTRVLELLTEEDIGRIDLRVENLSEENLTSVRVTLHLAGDHLLAFDEDGAPIAEPPDRPKAYRPTPSFLGGVSLGGFDLSSLELPSALPSFRGQMVVADTEVERRSDGNVDVHFNLGDLRPREGRTIGPAFIIAMNMNDASTLTANWSATSKDTSGVRTGTVALSVSGAVDGERAAEIGTRCL